MSGFTPVFTPFPGYSNFNSRGQIIAKEDNNGASDSIVPKSDSYGFSPDSIGFKDYTFTIDNLPSFRAYKIKILLTSTNQVYVPQMKNLRVISLA